MGFLNCSTVFGNQHLDSSFHSGMSCAAIEYLLDKWHCMHSNCPMMPRRMLVRKNRESVDETEKGVVKGWKSMGREIEVKVKVKTKQTRKEEKTDK